MQQSLSQHSLINAELESALAALSGGVDSTVYIRGLLTTVAGLGKEVQQLKEERKERQEAQRLQIQNWEEQRRVLEEEVRALRDARAEQQLQLHCLMMGRGGQAAEEDDRTEEESQSWAESVQPTPRSATVTAPSSGTVTPVTLVRPLLPPSVATTALQPAAPAASASSASPSPASIAAPPALPPRRPISATVLTTLPLQQVAPLAATAPPSVPPSLPPRPPPPAVTAPATPVHSIPPASPHRYTAIQTSAASPPSSAAAACSAPALPPLPASLSLESVLSYFHRQHALSDDYLQYLVPFIEEALETASSSSALSAGIRRVETAVLQAEYELLQRLGAGGFGEVYEAVERSSGLHYAVKVIDLEEATEDISSISQEVLSLSSHRSCGQLVAYYGCHVLHQHSLWLVMELVQDGSLLQQLTTRGPLSEDCIAIITREVLLGLQYMAGEGKIHRDIKAANVLINIRKSQIKLTDFGASRQLTDTMRKCNTLIGSPYWMAPEVLLRDDYDGKADVWSLGITLIELATGRPPHAHIPPMQVMSKIVSCAPPSLPPASERGPFSSAFVHFVSLCLMKEPMSRPSLPALLKHDFVRKAKSLSKLRGMFTARR